MDVLGPGYDAADLPLGADEEGELLATLITRRASRPQNRAVLYLHGFSDYLVGRPTTRFCRSMRTSAVVVTGLSEPLSEDVVRRGSR
ncbi:hypothetical protein [Nonomuraea typhae]|uniref:hypothetical protein n=1 Tax=Nonomuraea typhae TaxID=2603600 RepID=UPI0012F8FAEE|nr:hypothetical protein [Nonomuraea typhae]